MQDTRTAAVQSSSFIRRLQSRVHEQWGNVRSLFHGLRLAKISFVSVLFGFLLFFFAPQAQDLFLEVRGSLLAGTAFWIAFYFAVLAGWVLPVYISARWILSRFQEGLPASTEEKPVKEWVRRLVPPLLAVICLIAVLAGQIMCLINSPLGVGIFADGSLPGAGPLQHELSVAHLVVLPPLTLLISLLLWWALRPRSGGRATRAGQALMGIGGSNGPIDETTVTARLLSPVFFLVLALSIGVVLLLFLEHPVNISKLVYRALLVPFFLGLLVPAFTYLSYWSARSQAPLVIGTIVLLAVTATLAPDPHDVRTIDPQTARKSLDESVSRWAAANNCDLHATDPARTCPSPIIVSAAGGASRAAFHVAGLIGKLMDEKTYQGTISAAVYSADGKRVAIASSDTTARLWDAEFGTEIAVLKAHTSAVAATSFSPDGKRVVTASDDYTARVWDAETGKAVAVLQGHTFWVRSASFSPDSKRVATASHDSTARIWDGETGKVIAVLEGHTNSVRSVSFSPDGKRVVTASSDNTVRLWDAETRQEDAQTRKAISTFVLNAHGGSLWNASFSADGNRVVTMTSVTNSSLVNAASIWDVETGKVVAVLKAHTGEVMGASFSPDGKLVVTASADQTARVWETETGRQVAVLKGHTAQLNGAAFSPDGKRVVTASHDGTARLWDAGTGAEAMRFVARERPLRPFGKQLFAISGVSGGAVGAVVVYAALADSQLQERASNGVGNPPCRKDYRDTEWFARLKKETEADWRPHESWRSCLQLMLAGDFLSPVFVSLMSSDLLPFGRGGDRAAVLEQAWEMRYAEMTGQDYAAGYRQQQDATHPLLGSTLSASMLSVRSRVLAAGPGSWLPTLLLNGTSVATGRRIVASDFDTFDVFNDVYDLHMFLGMGAPQLHGELARDIRISTGGTMSARFPVISPHGNIRTHNLRIVDRVVDGGYYENFGGTTALELVVSLRRYGLKPFIILVNNEPTTSMMECVSETGGMPIPEPQQTAAFSTLTSPLKAVMGTRGARGSYAAVQLCGAVGRRNFAYVTVTKFKDDPDKTVSMSWWLSKQVQKYLNDQLEPETAGNENLSAFKRIQGVR